MLGISNKFGHRWLAFAISAPTILASVAFALSMICILAGTGPQQQQLEKYHILSLNMSYFGHDLIPTSTSDDPSSPTETSSGGGDDGGDGGGIDFPDIDLPSWGDNKKMIKKKARRTSKGPGPYTSFAASDSAAQDSEEDKVFNFEKRNALDDLSDEADSLWNDVTDLPSEAKDKLTDLANDLANDLVDKLSAELGISQWYSVHMLNWCEGNFAPNATTTTQANSTSGVTHNITSCSRPKSGSGAVRFQLNKILKEEISSGPLVQDLGMDADDLTDDLIPDVLQDAVDMLNKSLQAVLAFYGIGAGCAGLLVLTQTATMLLDLREGHQSHKRGLGRWWVPFVNLFLATLGAFALMLASAIATAVAKKGAAKINDKAGDLGVVAKEGMPFITLTWIAFGFMFVVAVFWQATYFCFRRRMNGNNLNEKAGSIRSG